MQNYLLPLLTKALNRYLSLDPESSARVQALNGKTITVELSGANIIFQLCFAQGDIELKTGDLLESQAKIKGTPLSLLRLALTKEKENRKSFFNEDLTIEGQTFLAEQVIAIFDHLEIDWEEYSSHWIGDVAAHQLGRFIRQIKSFNEKTCETLLQNTNEYVHEEANLFPCKEELEDFCIAVDEMRMDVDRLQKRVEFLRNNDSQKRSN